ncbi:hypothetical protein GGR58DRAFT_16306 [Xylaria digitata]|nr:hypothetical protein GGR58DRAFT_16306 [Xylaria digitata]
MARRKVVADSEDEDGGDDDVLLLQPGGDFDPPEPEPLSPHHRPSSPVAPNTHNQSSDVTDPSFFANIYDTQQILAVQQSHLVENIVRQSQRASASSGDVSLPTKRKGRANPSSGTDVTSPMILSRPRNHPNFLLGDTFEFTTPRKSAGQEWDVPSSPEDAAAPSRTDCSTNKEKAERKRRKSGLVSSLVADMPADEEITPRVHLEDIAVEDQVTGGLRADDTPTPVAKRAKLSHHDPVLQDTAKFYIAQSNLTTMQKLEYQKVNVSNSYGGLPGSLHNQKSSGATTIAYSTPSGYSSIPPLPWEESPRQLASPQRNEFINISSSPDMVNDGFDLPGGMVPVANMEIEILAPSESRESPVRHQSQTPVSKGQKRARQIVEEDELCQDNTDSDHLDLPQESYKPRATKRRSTIAAGFAGAEINSDTLDDILNEPIIQTRSPPKIAAPTLPDTDPPEPPPEAPTKKRGRKKKQPAADIPPPEEVINEDLDLNRNSASPGKATAAEPSLENPKKKKRGRPRKSESSKATEEPLLEPPIADELPKITSPQKESDPDNSAAVTRKQTDGKRRGRGGKGKTSEEIEGTDSAENRLPLKEVDTNLRTPSEAVSSRESPAETRTEPPRDEKTTPKAQSKENTKLGASQSKVPYRVGLSKRSRIAPLLKSIRK